MNRTTMKALITIFWTALLLFPAIGFGADNLGERAGEWNDMVKSFGPLIKTGAIVVGMGIAAWGVYGFMKDDRGGDGGMGPSLIKVLVGGTLAAFSFFIDTASQTAMGEDSEAAELLNHLEIVLPDSSNRTLVFSPEKQEAT